MTGNLEELRLDKWLWAARFFKTRSLATKAVSGGKVHLNSQRIKPSRLVQIGDTLHITKGTIEFEVRVEKLCQYRRPASEARLMYAESEESVTKREETKEFRKMVRNGYSAPPKKPNKQERRKIRKFIRSDEY